MRAAAHVSRTAEHPAVRENALRLFLRVACQALFDRFPSLILGMNERDIPREYDVAFIRPASLPVAWDGKPSTTVG
ncbi:hypothetical protein ABTY20_04535 [Streptomyces sp. NPDC126497]|uniref:hypothetical protein n=1 Tax=Streptomyces sp. NPDC126497 TaxID=3155313 RepID=UPI0033218951